MQRKKTTFIIESEEKPAVESVKQIAKPIVEAVEKPVVEQPKKSEKTLRKFLLIGLIAHKGEQLNIMGLAVDAKTPLQAAKKIFTKICKKRSIKAECEYQFILQREPDKKLLHYIGNVTKLSSPKQVKRGGKEYVVHFEPHVKKYKPK